MVDLEWRVEEEGVFGMTSSDSFSSLSICDFANFPSSFAIFLSTAFLVRNGAMERRRGREVRCFEDKTKLARPQSPAFKHHCNMPFQSTERWASMGSMEDEAWAKDRSSGVECASPDDDRVE